MVFSQYEARIGIKIPRIRWMRFDTTGGLVAAFSSTYILCNIETDRFVGRSIHRWGFDITGSLVGAFSSTYTLCNIETDRSIARSIITPATPSYSAAFSRWGSRFHYAYCIIYPKANNYVVCFVKWTSANYAANIVSTIYSSHPNTQCYTHFIRTMDHLILVLDEIAF